MQEEIASDGQNRVQKIPVPFLISRVTVCMNLSTSLHVISDGVKGRDLTESRLALHQVLLWEFPVVLFQGITSVLATPG